MIQHTSKIRVRYADTDQMRMVYYGKYFEYFEQGRTDLLRELGVPYSEIEKMGYHLPVVEAYARYRRPAGYDDLIEVKSMVKELPSTRVRIDYEVRRDGDSEILAEGYTVHLFVSAGNGRPTRSPDRFNEAIAKAFHSVTPKEDSC
ncbi:MAG: thioesterase family protein [Bacteroidota bacterium]